MVGGLGDDLYVIDNAGDQVIELEGGGFDLVQTARSWVATAGSWIERIVALGTASLNLTGNARSAVLEGNAGINTLDDGGGADTLMGMGGNDTYVVRNAATQVVEVAGEGFDAVRTTLSTYSLTDVVENLIFIGAGGFTAQGNSLVNVITGGAGADMLDGGAGGDRLIGGLGDDVYVADSAGDTIVENAGEGYDILVSRLSSDKARANVEALVYGGVGTFTGYAAATGSAIIGGSDADTLIGAAGSDTLDGGGGADSLVGGQGDDIFKVENAGDRVIELAGEGADTVRTTLGLYVLAAEVETLAYVGSAAFEGSGNALANRITGGAQGDRLMGLDGADTLDGGLGSDTLAGGAGHDLYLLDDAGDLVIEAAGEGQDSVQTSLTRVELAANVEGLVYTGAVAFEGIGNASANTITGGAGRDRLSGRDGADTLTGGRGDDTLDGGAGDDLASYAGGHGRYVITPDGAGGFYVQDRNSGHSEGRDRLTSVERVSFADGVFATADLAIGATLSGTDAANTLIGGSGDDVLIGFGGADLIYGGLGDDAAIFAGERDLFEVYGDGVGGFHVVEQLDGGRSGVRDHVVDVERLVFSDGSYEASETATGVLLMGGPGDQSLTGGAGRDGAAFDGLAGRYAVYADGAGGFYVEDQTGAGGRDHLNGIETLRFDDLTRAASDFVQGVFWVGGDGADALVGGPGGQRFLGGGGADTLVGAEGVDAAVYEGERSRYGVYADGDTLYVRDSAALGNAGVDRLTRIERLVFSDSVVDAAAATTGAALIGAAGADRLVAADLPALFIGGQGDDTLTGGAGRDVAVYSGAASRYVVRPDGQGGFTVQDTLDDEGVDHLTSVEDLHFADATWDARARVVAAEIVGTEAADTLVGSAGDDTLSGLGGDDVAVYGGERARYVVQPDGARSYRVTDTLAGPAGDGVDHLVAIEWLSFADGLFSASGAAIGASLTGTADADELHGGMGADTLDGAAGADTLIGDDGDDLYIVDQPGDVIDEAAGGGIDTISTTLTRYELGDNVENLTFTGDAPFVGIGNALNNVITGGYSAETLTGGAGDDTYVVFAGAKTIVETADGGVDTVVTNSTFVLPDHVENLQMSGVGNRGARLSGVGNSLANRITGSPDDQVLIGLAGDDTLTGAGGDDVFVFRSGSGRDTITDFSAGDGGDEVRLSDVSFTTLAQVRARMTQVGADVVLALSDTDQITFQGVSIDDFTLDNFKLPFDLAGLTLAFEDNFDSLSLTDGVSGVWQTTYGYLGAGPLPSRTLALTGEDQIYVDPAYAGSGDTALGLNPFSLADGVLSIKASATPEALKDKLYGYEYTSGLLTSQSSFSQTYGYYEIRAMLPGAAGAWPAFWLLPSSGSSPPEIDIIEGIGVNPEFSYLTLHDAYLPGRAVAEIVHTPGATTSFHTYGLLWSDTDLVWYIDGVEVLRVPTPQDLHQPMYMLFNLAVGGGFGGGLNVPDAAALGDAAFQIDYVRAYAIDGLTIADNTTGLQLDNRVTSTVTGGAGDDTILGGAGFRYAFGGSAEIYGRNGVDRVIYSGARADYEVFTDGHGGYFVTGAGLWKGADHLSGVERIQFADQEGVLSTIAGDLYLQGSPSAEALTGTDGDDIVLGHAAFDTLDGGAGSDTLAGGAGNDVLRGGLGADTAFFSSVMADYEITMVDGALVVRDRREWSPEGTDTLTGIETLRFSDQAIAAPGSTYVFAPTGGSLVYDPTSAVRTILGGAGDDVLVIDLPEGAGAGPMGFTVSADGLTLLADLDSDGAPDLIVSGVEDIEVTGAVVTFVGDFSRTGLAPHTIHYTGSASGDLLDASGLTSAEGVDATGLGGADTLKGGAGRDTLSGGDGADTLQGGSGDDLLLGGAGVDSLHVSDGSDEAHGGDGDDFFWFGVDPDLRPPQKADTTLNGGSGTDTIDLGLLKVGATVDLNTKGRLQDIGFGRLNQTAIENIAGGEGDDRLSGDSGANSLWGRAGADTLGGGAGDDSLQGGAGDDQLDGGGGTDTVSYITALAGVRVSLALTTAQDTGGDGVDTLKSIEVLFGSNHNDSLTGGASADLLNGWLGHDTLDGGGGTDTLIGGAGDDVYRLDSARDVIVETFGSGFDSAITTVSYVLAAGVSIESLSLVAGASAINLTGNSYAQTLVGNAGINVLDGGGGADTMIGGAGNDIYLADSASDAIVELAGGGYDTVRTTATTYTLGAELEVLTFTGTGPFKGTGNALANVITGGAGVDVLDGGAGADRLVGGVGNDTYVVDNIADAVIENANEGFDTVRTAIQAYSLAANIENLVYTGVGSIQAFGNVLTNVITGGTGNDILDGRAGADRLIGGLGDDIYYTDHVGDTVVELAGQGRDRLLTTLNSAKAPDNVEELLFIGAGNFQGFANAAGTSLFGGAGADTLTGAAGSDFLGGMAGADVLTGGAGADIFYFDAPGLGVDRITDFQVGVDHIALRGASFGLVSTLELFSGPAALVPPAAAGEALLRYDIATGALYLDANGGDASDQVQIAVLNGRPALTQADILLG